MQRATRNLGEHSKRYGCPCCSPWKWRGAYGGDARRADGAARAMRAAAGRSDDEEVSQYHPTSKNRSWGVYGGPIPPLAAKRTQTGRRTRCVDAGDTSG